jgi:hypothetical protein
MEGGKETFKSVKEKVAAGKVAFDEYGNMLVRVGDDIYVFDGATQEFLGTLDKLGPEMADVAMHHDVLMDKTKELAAEYGVAWQEVWDLVNLGWDEVQTILDSGEALPDWYRQAAEAADQVWIALAANMVNLGINPRTGEDLPTKMAIGAIRRYGADITAEEYAEYLMTGSGV